MKDLKKYPKTLSEVRKVIQQKYPELDIGRDHGRYFWTSKNDELETKLCGMVYSKSVDVYSCKHITLEAWLAHADDIMDEVDNHEYFSQGRRFMTKEQQTEHEVKHGKK